MKTVTVAAIIIKTIKITAYMLFHLMLTSCDQVLPSHMESLYLCDRNSSLLYRCLFMTWSPY